MEQKLQIRSPRRGNGKMRCVALVGFSIVLYSSAVVGAENGQRAAEIADVTGDPPPARQPIQQDPADLEAMPPPGNADILGICISDETGNRCKNLAELTNQYDNVIVINKSPHVQKMRVYRFGQTVLTAPVSTGKEAYSCEWMKDSDGWTRREPVWRGTPTGFYVADHLDIDHYSSQFQNARMTYAAFFTSGVATHQAPPGTESLLGERTDSHGCVRMRAADAAQVFKWVLWSGQNPDLNHPGLDGFTGKCPDGSRCSVDERTKMFLPQVKEMLREGSENQLGRNGEATSFPQNDKVEVDDVNPVNGEPVKNKPKKRFRTLYVVECIEPDGTDCSVKDRKEKPSCILQAHHYDFWGRTPYDQRGRALIDGAGNPLVDQAGRMVQYDPTGAPHYERSSPQPRGGYPRTRNQDQGFNPFDGLRHLFGG